MQTNILDKIYTINNLNMLLIYLKDYSVFLEQKELQARALDKKTQPIVWEAPVPKSIEIMLAGVVELEKMTYKELENLIEQLKKIKENAQIIYITLARIYSNDFLVNLIGWFRKNIQKDLLVEFDQDPEMIDGIKIRTRNRLYDYSLNNLLEVNQDKIAHIISDELQREE